MINIGSRRECFFDDYLIDTAKTTAEQRLHKPVRRGELLEMNKPWEGSYTTMYSIIEVAGKYKMYYTTTLDSFNKFICYAESENGEDWVRPNLGIAQFEGSKENNIIMDLPMLKEFDFVNFDNLSVFYDENPNCPTDEKYKLTANWIGHASLVALFSADGIHFTKMQFITDKGAFDSQNRAFWSKEHGKYFAYYRGEHDPAEDVDISDKSYTDKVANALFDPLKFLLREPGAGTHTFMRDIRMIESKDFKEWSEQRLINTSGKDYQLYFNIIFPYPRAEHILIGFPLRYVERKSWTKNYDELCGKEKRLERMANMARLGLAITDGLFMSSRDGYNFKKYDEALIPPPAENPEAFVYGDGTAAPAVIEVPSNVEGGESEYMLVVREAFRSVAGPNKLVKYTIRKDGFVSFHAGGEEKELVSKEFVYSGEKLFANIETSARGALYFTLKCGDEEYTSVETFGNSCDKRVHFEDDEIVKRFSGKPVTLKIKMFDCDIYSIKFE